MNYDLARFVRDLLGRSLLAASRHLSRYGARLVGHPSAGEKPGRPVLRVVVNGNFDPRRTLLAWQKSGGHLD